MNPPPHTHTLASCHAAGPPESAPLTCAAVRPLQSRRARHPAVASAAVGGEAAERPGGARARHRLQHAGRGVQARGRAGAPRPAEEVQRAAGQVRRGRLGEGWVWRVRVTGGENWWRNGAEWCVGSDAGDEWRVPCAVNAGSVGPGVTAAALLGGRFVFVCVESVFC